MFSRSKDERAAKAPDVKKGNGAAQPGPSSQTVSKLGEGMLITGNIVCDGALQIYGHVLGDIHATQLTICAGARVEGNIIAQDTVIDGVFKGTIRSNTVKLHGNAVVEGEVFNKSLNIGENAQFEGISRRLDKPVDPPPTVSLQPEAALSPLADQETARPALQS